MRTTTLFRNSLIAAGLLAALPLAAVAQQAATAQPDAMQTTSAPQSSANQTVPDKAADTWITTKVKSEFATAKHLKSTDISVSTSDGVVSLTGSVASTKQKNHAEQIAKGVKGVKSVDASGLTVGTAASQ